MLFPSAADPRIGNRSGSFPRVPQGIFWHCAKRKKAKNAAAMRLRPLPGIACQGLHALRIKAESLEPTSEIVNPPHMIGFMESMY
jgi:hypothetical protein